MSKFIVIEGPDGTGKNTQTKMLVSRLKEEGYKVMMISFPNYGSTGCKPVEEYLGGDIKMSTPKRASLLYCVDRIYTMEKLAKEIEEHDFIVLDRYVTSNILHQATKLDGYKRTKMIEELRTIEYQFAGLPEPDCVVYLDLEYDIASKLRDIRGNKDIHENDEEYMRKVHNAGKDIAVYEGWSIVDCTDGEKISDREAIHESVFTAVFTPKENLYD